MSIRTQAYRRIAAKQMAEWIDSQPSKWWLVDGDPQLMQSVDFPCPSDELAEAIRKIGRDLIVRDPQGQGDGSLASTDQIEGLADTTNPGSDKTFLCSWADAKDEDEWLLCEDASAMKAYAGS